MHGGNNLMTTAFVNYLFTSFEHCPADGFVYMCVCVRISGQNQIELMAIKAGNSLLIKMAVHRILGMGECGKKDFRYVF
jgi:hypothetical protein